MIKKIMVPLMGLSVIGFVGCSDIQIPENAVNQPAQTQNQNQNNGQPHMRHQHRMVKECKGAIAGKVNTKPMYVTMEKIVVEEGVKPAATVSGTAYNKRYTCQFDTESNFLSVYPN